MFRREMVAFRPLQIDDLRRMFAWLHDLEVAAWYGPTPSHLSDLERKYGPRISGDVPVKCFIVEYDAQPVGYIQTYPLSHDPEYAAVLGMGPNAAGVDVFIGEPDFRHRGLGPIMLQEFVTREVFQIPGVSCCVISPAVNNEAAIRSYAKAGFRHVKTVEVPGEDEPEYVMVIWPDDLARSVRDLDRERMR